MLISVYRSLSLPPSLILVRWLSGLALLGMLVGVFLCNAGVAASFCTISLEADAREVRGQA